MAKKKKVPVKRVNHINKNTVPFINALNKLTDDERKAVLKYLNKDAREVIYECVANCIYNPGISKAKRAEVKEQLKSKSRIYKYLARPGNNLKKKKQLLSQHGGGLGLILGAVLPLLTALFSK